MNLVPHTHCTVVLQWGPGNWIIHSVVYFPRVVTRLPWTVDHQWLRENVIKPSFHHFCRHSLPQHSHRIPSNTVPNICTQHQLKAPRFVHLVEHFESLIVPRGFLYPPSLWHRAERTMGIALPCRFYTAEVVVPKNYDDPKERRGCDG